MPGTTPKPRALRVFLGFIICCLLAVPATAVFTGGLKAPQDIGWVLSCGLAAILLSILMWLYEKARSQKLRWQQPTALFGVFSALYIALSAYNLAHWSEIVDAARQQDPTQSFRSILGTLLTPFFLAFLCFTALACVVYERFHHGDQSNTDMETFSDHPDSSDSVHS
ncbi:hypothetical protein [Actinobaculum sp. 313]|uniref:hypothetical protein n=1 Tax=Actinobaculum sp. 313 TaxID=2495645 RepID=UPI000D526D54|nr:hypothetical protein [Actinobaculum sp. 313]AWE42067.1 hypothetical protein DDD63_04030 [Actinobaculum sp. 313]